MKTKHVYFLSIILFVLLLFLIPKNLFDVEFGRIILTCSTFLFGLLAGFFIVVTTTDYNAIKNVLAAETAGWIALYRNIFIYDKETAGKVSDLVDEYIIKSFNYEIIDYAKCTEKEFDKIENLVRGIEIKDGKINLFQNIQQTMERIIISRQQLVILGQNALSKFQWIVLFALSFLVVASLFGLRNGEIFFEFITVLISSSIVLILLLIRELDLYVWNEKNFGYYIFENVLRSVGKLPYYPLESIKKGRIQPREEKYRIGTLIDYPKSQERKIEINESRIKEEKARAFDL